MKIANTKIGRRAIYNHNYAQEILDSNSDVLKELESAFNEIKIENFIKGTNEYKHQYEQNGNKEPKGNTIINQSLKDILTNNKYRWDDEHPIAPQAEKFGGERLDERFDFFKSWSGESPGFGVEVVLDHSSKWASNFMKFQASYLYKEIKCGIFITVLKNKKQMQECDELNNSSNPCSHCKKMRNGIHEKKLDIRTCDDCGYTPLPIGYSGEIHYKQVESKMKDFGGVITVPMLLIGIDF